MCAHLRKMVCPLPRPEVRSGCADRKKITPISSTGGAKRDAIPVMLCRSILLLDVDDPALGRRLVLEAHLLAPHRDRPLDLVRHRDLLEPDAFARGGPSAD